MPHKRKDLKLTGSNLWYLVGLITSDGSLSKDGRHVDITSSNYEFLCGVNKLIGSDIKIGVKYGGFKRQKAFHIQITNRNFYEFLLSIGLMPNKSLILEKVEVPDSHFNDFLRGLIDGDGGIQKWVHHTNKREQWNLRVASGSKKFLEWLQNKIENLIGVKGGLYTQSPTQHRLKYGKMAAKVITQKCYYEGAFALERKKNLADLCINSYRGWVRSKTIVPDGRVMEWQTCQT